MPVLALNQSRRLRYITFFYLYVMQGIPAGFALTAIANYLTATGQSAATVGTFVAMVGLPWTFQFIWGPFIDQFQGGATGHRRPWVLISQLLAFVASLGILLIDQPEAQIPALTFAFFCHSVFASVQDASVDAMAISIIPESERGRVNAFMRGGFLVGIGLGAATLSYLLRHAGFFYAALAQSASLLAMTMITFFIKERPEDTLLPRFLTRHKPSFGPHQPRPHLQWLFGELFRGIVSQRSLLLFSSIILVYLSQSIFIRTISFHLIDQLHWPDTSLSILTGTLGTLIRLIVLLIGGFLVDKIGFKRFLVVIMAVVGSFLLTFNLLSPLWNDRNVITTGLAIWYMMDPAFSVAAMPLLMSICRKGVEGSQFTTYMALVNLAEVIGAYLSGYALSWISAPVIGFLCGLLTLTAIGIAWFAFQTRKVAA